MSDPRQQDSARRRGRSRAGPPQPRRDNGRAPDFDQTMRYTLFATCSALFTVIVLTILSRWVPNAATVQIAIGAVGTIMTSAFGVTALYLRRDRRQ
jgi:hypothetical protein